MTATRPVPAARPGHRTVGHHPEWERIADLFATLSHPVRVRILELVAEQHRTGSEVVAALGLPPARVSRHLAVLRQAGLLGCANQGGSRHWTLLDPGVLEVLSRARAVLLAAEPPDALNRRWADPMTAPRPTTGITTDETMTAGDRAGATGAPPGRPSRSGPGAR
jgi:ArsR family transcriptional regulator